MQTTLLKAARGNGSLPFPKPPLPVADNAAPVLPTPTWKKELYTNAQLAPCPFCGAAALPPSPTRAMGVADANEEHCIACSDEGCMGMQWGPTLIDTILRWNKRAGIPAGMEPGPVSDEEAARRLSILTGGKEGR